MKILLVLLFASIYIEDLKPSFESGFLLFIFFIFLSLFFKPNISENYKNKIDNASNCC